MIRSPGGYACRLAQLIFQHFALVRNRLKGGASKPNPATLCALALAQEAALFALRKYRLRSPPAAL